VSGQPWPVRGGGADQGDVGFSASVSPFDVVAGGAVVAGGGVVPAVLAALSGGRPDGVLGGVYCGDAGTYVGADGV
jgi:hypothetical protein